jgi:hypothetical protein
MSSTVIFIKSLVFCLRTSTDVARAVKPGARRSSVVQSERKKRRRLLPFIRSNWANVTRSVAVLSLVLTLQWELQLLVVWRVLYLVMWLVRLALKVGMQNEKGSWHPPVSTFVTNFVKIGQMFQNLNWLGVTHDSSIVSKTHFLLICQGCPHRRSRNLPVVDVNTWQTLKGVLERLYEYRRLITNRNWPVLVEQKQEVVKLGNMYIVNGLLDSKSSSAVCR